MSAGQASVGIVKSTDTIEIGDIRSFADREMKNLQEAVARRLQTLEELVTDIATAQTLEALEEREIECSLRFAALREEFAGLMTSKANWSCGNSNSSPQPSKRN